MTMIASVPLGAPGDGGAVAPAAALFRSMSDPSRLTILAHLMLGEHKVVELTEHLGLSQSTVSAHLKCLLECGLVQVRAEGRASLYSIAAVREITDVLVAAERLLVATGDAAVHCAVRGGHR